MSGHRFGTVVATGLALASGGAVLASMAGPPATEQTVDFVRDVQPILAVSCVRCHAAALAQGTLRLDTREGLRQGGASGPAVQAGDGKGSLLYQRLLPSHPPQRLPWVSHPPPPPH